MPHWLTFPIVVLSEKTVYKTTIANSSRLPLPFLRMKMWLVFLLLSLPVTTSHACPSLIALESWKPIAKRFSEDLSVIEPLRNGLTPEARGYALIDMSGVINEAIAKKLFELIPSDGRYNAFDRRKDPENPPPDAVKVFGSGFSQTLLEILNHALKDIEPSPLKIKLIQFRRYRQGMLAVSEKRNGSENFHVDGRNVYLRAFVTLLGPGLIIGENAPDGIRARQMPRATVCVFSSAGRTAVHPAVRSTLHRGPTDKGVYDSDRLSIVVDFFAVTKTTARDIANKKRSAIITRMGRAGFSILSVIIATAVVGAAFTYSQINSTASKKSALETSQKVVAETYATELMEYLRSHPSTDLLEYLKTNPGGGAGLYPICAHINIINRQNGSIVNPDPIAVLPPNPLDGAGPKLKSNRFYQVSVIDLNTMQVKTDPYCHQTATSLPALNASERLLVTVGVSWVPIGASANEPKRVTMSTVLPR